MTEGEEGDGKVGGALSGRNRSAASTVAAGIFSSRLLGLVREALLAYFFGVSRHADVFSFALRGPNLLQNLLGEQSLSASFIPVYSRLLEEGRSKEAGRLAGAVFGLLLAAAAGLALIGLVLAAPLVSLFSPGYLGDAREVAAGAAAVDRFPLAVAAVRIMFPMAGLLVLSAWCLGVLNSHRRFFLPYFAPVLWNSAIIAALIAAAGWTAAPGESARDRLLFAACWGALAGGALQFLVQLPMVRRLVPDLRLSLSTRIAGVRETLRAFGPLVAGRGVVQLSGYLDLMLSSLLAAGAQASLRWAQVLYLLPISLFGLSVAATELPDLARESTRSGAEGMSGGLRAAIRQTSFLTLPTSLGYLAFGLLVVGGLYRRGSFGREDQWLVYLVLCAYSLGLPASNVSRVLNNAFYAMGLTRIPARIAAERVGLSAAAGAALMIWADRFSVVALIGGGGPERLYLGALGLAGGAGLASWYELWRVRRRLVALLPELRLPVAALVRMGAAALLAAVAAGGVWAVLPPWPLIVQGALVLAVYGGCYLALARAVGVSELARWLGRSSGGERRES